MNGLESGGFDMNFPIFKLVLCNLFDLVLLQTLGYQESYYLIKSSKLHDRQFDSVLLTHSLFNGSISFYGNNVKGRHVLIEEFP